MDSSISFFTDGIGRHFELPEGDFWGLDATEEVFQSTFIADSLHASPSTKVTSVALSLLTRLLIRKGAHYLIWASRRGVKRTLLHLERMPALFKQL